jgi:hypothetical protein
MSRRERLRRAPGVVLPVVFLLLLSLPAVAFAQDEQKYPTFRFDGQLRLRTEADGRTVGTDPDFATLSRIRFGVRAGLLDWMDVYLQLQDARAWGIETNTLVDASADLFDMHQGYVDMGARETFTARLGRQEMPLADERLVGAVGWSNTGRSFDGVRAFGKDGGIGWTAFVMNLVERDSLLAVGLHPQVNQGAFDDGWLIGGTASGKYGDVTTEVTAVYDRKAATDESYTVNLRLHGRSGAFLYEGAGAYQFGPDRSAWFASGKAGVAVGMGTVALQLDYLSGNADPADTQDKAFNTLYATNHKFYGYMDYFLFIPQQLDRAGLVDAMLRGSLNTSATTSVRLDVHRFRTAQERNGLNNLGTEIDLVGNWRMAKPASLQVGVAAYVPEELMTQVFPAFAGGESTTWWGYAQLIVNWP